MASGTSAVLHRVVRSARNAETAAATDRELLRRFATDGEEAAFAALVTRHTPMVVGVCRRVLPTVQDAEDACQATFVILARKAKSERWQPSAANWLYTTARHVADKARRADERRRKRENRAAVPEAVEPIDRWTVRELLAALDQELDRLPARYREPLVLCYLEGLSREEAAARLGVPPGTVKIRLERGRKRLGDALTLRGCALGAGLLAVATLSPAGASPPRLIQAVLASASGSPSAAVAALAKGVAVNGILRNIGFGIAGLATILAFGFGWNRVEQATAQTKENDPKPIVVKAEKSTAVAADATVPEKVKILVLAADGKPVARATLRRLTKNGQELVNETVLGKTDAVGGFEAEVIPFCTITATADGVGAAWSGSVTSSRELTLKMARPQPIKGRLVDLQGKPVPNAKVSVVSLAAAENDDLTAAYNAYRVNPEWAGSAFSRRLDGTATGAPASPTTDADGRFELSGVGKCQVVYLRFLAAGIDANEVAVFADPEFANRIKPPTDAEKQKNSFFGHQHKPAVYGPEFTHAAQPEHLLTGTVVDSVTGKPIAGVAVWGTTVPLASTAAGHGFWRNKATAVTDAKGRFTLHGLPKAVLWDLPFVPKEKNRYLHVRAEGTPYLDQLVVVPDTSDLTPATVEVKLRPAVVVSGTIANKSTGKPIRGEVKWFPLNSNEVIALRKDEAAKLYAGDLGGGVSPSGIRRQTDKDGRFQLQVPSGSGVLLARADDSDLTTLFTSLLVRYEDRKYLRKPDAENKVEGRTTGVRTRDAEEEFDIHRLSWPNRWENGYAVIDPDPKATAVAVKIEFDPGLTVALRVADADGKPLKGVTVAGDGPLGPRTPTYNTAEFRIGGLNPTGRPQRLALVHWERKLCAELTVTGDEKGPVTVTMQRCAAVTGRVVDHTGKPVKDAQVSYQMPVYEANSLIRSKLFRGSYTTTTNAEGTFTFERMFPGHEIDLFVSIPGFRSGSAEAKRTILKPGEAKDVGEFKLRDPKKRDDGE